MPKHGLVAAGSTAGTAVMHAVLLEQACRIQLDAMAAGELTVYSDPDEAIAKRALCWPPSQLESGWRYWLRKSADLPEPPDWTDEEPRLYAADAASAAWERTWSFLDRRLPAS
jgi:hypothetical protein